MTTQERTGAGRATASRPRHRRCRSVHRRVGEIPTTVQDDGGANVRDGGFQVRPLGGAPGCLAMILLSIIASVVLTIVVNLLL
jgi:hypothetical protein